MKVGAAIYNLLTTDAAVSALVGTRVFPELAVEGGNDPYIVYSVVSNTPVDTKDKAPVDEAQIEVFSVANTYAKANDLADKVRAALSRKGKVVYDTVTVQSIQYTNEVVEVTPERDFYICVQDYTVRSSGVVARPDFLFDSYGGALGAYSLRQLNVNYTGAAVTVRRESDNATKDIGFDVYGNLDTHTLTHFCANTNGFVSAWKDQSGNSNDATQTTPELQPQIITNGAVYLVNNRPALYWNDNELNADGLIGQDRIDAYISYKTSDTNYILFASQIVNGRFSAVVQADSASTSLSFDWTQVGALPTIYQNGTQVAIDADTTRDDLVGLLVNDQLNIEVHENARTDEWPAFGISKYQGFRQLDGYISELVVYNTDQSANRTGIENNTNTYYNIY